jgi:site-specific DNA recombinase
VTGERISDKIAASKQKGIWMGGAVILGYDVRDHRLVVNAVWRAGVRKSGINQTDRGPRRSES